ncbi:hypothetical protein J7K86_00520 [bacterium]|nr:hypothetical protein [bacterium]
MKKIFLICPVRKIDKETLKKISAYVKKLEKKGFEVHWPLRDTKQDDPTGGLQICLTNSQALVAADEVHIWYDPHSQGSVFDLGVYFGALACGKKKKFVLANANDVKATKGKSFTNVILSLTKK